MVVKDSERDVRSSKIVDEVRDRQLLEIQKQWQQVRELGGQRAFNYIKIDGKLSEIYRVGGRGG